MYVCMVLVPRRLDRPLVGGLGLANTVLLTSLPTYYWNASPSHTSVHRAYRASAHLSSQWSKPWHIAAHTGAVVHLFSNYQACWADLHGYVRESPHCAAGTAFSNYSRVLEPPERLRSRCSKSPANTPYSTYV